MTFLRNIIATFTLMSCFCIPVRGNSAESGTLPPGVVKALAKYEKEYCEEFLGEFRKGCHQKFRANLLWQPLVITQSGQTAFLVENRNSGFGGVRSISLCPTVEGEIRSNPRNIRGHGNRDPRKHRSFECGHERPLQHSKTWRDGKTCTLYLWDGARYSSLSDDGSC
jgi:hypothetical protein